MINNFGLHPEHSEYYYETVFHFQFSILAESLGSECMPSPPSVGCGPNNNLVFECYSGLPNLCATPEANVKPGQYSTP